MRQVLAILAISLVLLIPLGIFWAPGIMAVIVTVILALAPIYLPVILLAILAPLWVLYARSQYVSAIPYVLIELKPGDSTTKPAKAMELIFYSLYHRTDVSRVSAILVGQVRLPWSFEIAASAGTVRFFIRMPTAHQAAVEARVRSEYRDIDISPARDYAREVSAGQHARLVAREYGLGKSDSYPLKTYESYGADAADPFTTLLNNLIQVSEGEHILISLIARPHQRERVHLWDQDERDTLHEEATHEVEHLTGHSGTLASLPPAKQRVVKAIEDALKKPSFDVGARALYIASHAAYKGERAQSLDTLFAPFNDADLNTFVARDPAANFGWPLSDLFHAVPALMPAYLLNLYRRRAYFAPPYYGKPFVLNTAELATVWHLPRVTHTSALSRARGTRLEPPDNLPLIAV